jgi:hypothetical protein
MLHEIKDYALSRKRTCRIKIGDQEIILGSGAKAIITNMLAVFALITFPDSFITTVAIAFFATASIMKYAIDIDMEISYLKLILYHVIHMLIFVIISGNTIYGIVVSWFLAAIVLYDTKGDVYHYRGGE